MLLEFIKPELIEGVFTRNSKFDFIVGNLGKLRHSKIIITSRPDLYIGTKITDELTLGIHLSYYDPEYGINVDEWRQGLVLHYGFYIEFPESERESIRYMYSMESAQRYVSQDYKFGSLDVFGVNLGTIMRLVNLIEGIDRLSVDYVDLACELLSKNIEPHEITYDVYTMVFKSLVYKVVRK